MSFIANAGCKSHYFRDMRLQGDCRLRNEGAGTADCRLHEQKERATNRSRNILEMDAESP